MDQRTTAILSGPEMAEAPFTDVFAYWQSLCEGAWAPDWPTFRLDEIEPQLLPWSIVVDVEDGGRDFFYRFWGTERVSLIGHEMTGKRTSDIPDHYMREANLAEYRSACQHRAPILCNTPVVTAAGRQLTFQSLRLPLAGPDGELGHIYSVINYLQVTAIHYEYYGTKPRRR